MCPLRTKHACTIATQRVEILNPDIEIRDKFEIQNHNEKNWMPDQVRHDPAPRWVRGKQRAKKSTLYRSYNSRPVGSGTHETRPP